MNDIKLLRKAEETMQNLDQVLQLHMRYPSCAVTAKRCSDLKVQLRTWLDIACQRKYHCVALYLHLRYQGY